MSKTNIKATIDALIKQNGEGRIRGDVLNSVLTDMLNGLAEEGTATPHPVDVVDGQDADLDIADEEGYVLARLSNGEIETKQFDSRKSPYVSSIEDNKDLRICDKNGNVLVEFSGGHIKTKLFDSRNEFDVALFTKKFAGKKIAIIGDSISTYQGWLASNTPGYSGDSYAYYYPRGDVNSPSKTWWYIVCEALGINPSTDLCNCSWSGSRLTGDSTATTTAQAGCSTKRINDLSAKGFDPDIVICYISCNDWGNTPYIPIGTWQTTSPVPNEGNMTELRAAYALMLDKIHKKYPFARVFCCTNLDDVRRDEVAGYPSSKNNVTTNEWNQNIKDVAHAFGCDVIDLHRCGINYANIYPHFCEDSGLHPNAAGHLLMARKVIAELFAKY